MSNSKLTKEEYKKQLKEYVKSVGPNPGEGFWSRAGWHYQQEQKFKNRLRRENIEFET